MKVILKADIKGVGKKDQIINASDGYVRNFLLPKNLAVEANTENMSKLKAKQDSNAFKKSQEKEEAEIIASKLSKIILKIRVKSGENGKIFGGVSSKEISDNLQNQYNIRIDKKKIELKDPIKSLGTRIIEIKLFEGVIGKVKIDVRDMNIDTLSLSGHKIYAPKGIGVLYVKSETKFTPLIFGHQEGNRRGGTENVPYIIGLGKAVKMILEDKDKANENIEYLRNLMEMKMKEKIEDSYIYGDLENRLPNTTNVAFKGIKGEEILLLLENHGIYIGTGSACNSQNIEPSHVLTAMGADLSDSSPIRISLGKYNTKEEIDKFVEVLENVVKMLRRRK